MRIVSYKQGRALPPETDRAVAWFDDWEDCYFVADSITDEEIAAAFVEADGCGGQLAALLNAVCIEPKGTFWGVYIGSDFRPSVKVACVGDDESIAFDCALDAIRRLLGEESDAT